MMRKFTMMLWLLLLCVSSSFAQSLCGFDQIHQRLLATDPVYRQRNIDMEKKWQEFNDIKNNTASRMIVTGVDTTYEIPVVVHVIHTGGAIGSIYNPSDATLTAWVAYLDSAYQANWTGYPTPTTGGTKFPYRFVLAKRSPTCTATNGIVRYDASGVTGYTANGLNSSNTNGASDATIASLSRWDPRYYYNVYVVNKIDGVDGFTAGSAYVAGYAYFPASSNTIYGAFMLAKTAVAGDVTLVHEMGHAMGLLHTFQGANPNGGSCAAAELDCNAEGDFICDTELSPSGLNFTSCPVSGVTTNPCTGNPYQGVQFNIMNYGNCTNRFTAGQRDRTKVQFLGVRTSLLYSLGSQAPDASTFTIAASCTPGTITNNTNTFNMGPCNVTLGSIQYQSEGYNIDGNLSYIDHTSEHCMSGNSSTTLTVNQGTTLTVSVETNPQRVKAYIDWNNNGTFDVNTETVMNVANAAATQLTPSVQTATIIPPASAVLNTPLRMRVTSDFASSSDFTPCSTLAYGQTEDFYVTVLSNIPLALNLTAFNAQAKGCNADLTWTMADKTPVQYFEVQRSVSATAKFETISKVDWNSNNLNYTFEDNRLQNSSYVYRIKMVDNAGNETYSKSKEVTTTCNTPISVYPNPFMDYVIVNAPNIATEAISYSLTDMAGRMVRTSNKVQVISGNEVRIDLKNLTPGIYFLKINSGNKVSNFKIVK